MAQKKPEMIVIFRVDKKGTVIALFPEEANYWKGDRECACYYNGSAGIALYQATIKKTRPAKPSEYRALLKELNGLQYGEFYKLVVRQRFRD